MCLSMCQTMSVTWHHYVSMFLCHYTKSLFLVTCNAASAATPNLVTFDMQASGSIQIEENVKPHTVLWGFHSHFLGNCPVSV